MTEQITTISRSDARRLAIAHQGLHAVAPFGKSRRGVYEAIAHLGYVQIDTISVVERAHHHILWTRVPDYSHRHLLDLQLKDRLVLEFWAHAAAYIPMKDYRFLMPTMEYFRNHHDPWPKSDRKTMRWVLERIHNEGPLKSRDFEVTGKKGKPGWWEWKPAKLALQRLFFHGDIMVSHREGFQRVFNITDRVIPSETDTSPPSTEAFARYLIRNTIRAHGIARVQEMYYLRRGMGGVVRKVLDQMLDANEIVEVRVKGVDGTFYSSTENLHKPLRITNRVKLLSPFDNAVIQRDRLHDIFDFEYQIECYVPKPKRKYGYYCLPILYGDQFYGRVDVKADRKTGELQLIHVHLENRKFPEHFTQSFVQTCVKFAKFNKCDSLILGQVSPHHMKRDIAEHISAVEWSFSIRRKKPAAK